MNIDIDPDLKNHVDKKLIRRIKILILVFVVMTGALMYEIFLSDINPLWLLLGVGSGFSIGFLAGRMFSIEWHPEDKKVIGRLDLIGAIVLVLYIGVSIARHWVFAHWFAGATLTAFTFSFIEGAMLGRIASMRLNIKRVLVEQGKIEEK